MVPEGWKICSLRDVASFSNGKAHEKYIVEDGQFVVVNSKFISTDGEIRKFTDSNLCPASKNDILMVMSDVPNGKAIAKCFYVDKDNAYTVNQRIAVLKAKSAHPLFLFYSLNRNGYYLGFDDGITQTNLRKDEVLNCPLRLPNSFQEQKTIAQILSTWDKAIETVEALIENSKAQKKALMQQLLTGERRLKNFHNEVWKRIPIAKMGQIVSGGTPDTGNHKYWDGEVLWTTPTDITALQSRFIYDTERKITRDGVNNSSANLLPTGSLLVCTRATIGFMAISQGEITTNQGFKSLVPNVDLDVDFLYYLFMHFKNKFVRMACGSTFLELSKKDFQKLDFDVPGKENQRAIATVLSDMDEEISSLGSQLSYLYNEKKALMQQLLTGKRRVRIAGEAA